MMAKRRRVWRRVIGIHGARVLVKDARAEVRCRCGALVILGEWDAFLNPLLVFRDTVSHYGDPVWFMRAVTLSVFFSACIGLGYFFFLVLYRDWETI